jgi:predicted dehydrogenase
MEIYGREGTLVASGEDSPQLSDVGLHGAQRGDTLTPVPVPQRFTIASAETPSGEAFNVGQMYALFAQAIRGRSVGGAIGGDMRQPDFATAVELHLLVDAIKQASDEGREVTTA